MRIFGLLLFVGSLLLSAQSKVAADASHCVVVSDGAPPLPAKLMDGQGKINFPITTSNVEARRFFEQGVAQMHSFWAREAERSFLQAAAIDPSAPMPWWGVAMVASGDFRPHFQLVRDRHKPGTLPSAANDKRALAAAQKARELAAKTPGVTPLEKMYIDAIWARRNPDTVDTDLAYTQGLRAIIAAHPKEVEARTYLALHLMDGFVLPAKKPRPGSMEAVELLKALAVEFPEHPGVHHYIIHGWEGSGFAKDAWDSCKKYAELVDNIPHALHMPGHIYAQTGKLTEANQAFTSAAVLERKYMASDKDYGNGHHGHNVNFLAVVQAAAGKYDEAIAGATELLTFAETEKEKKNPDAFRTAYRQGFFAMMRTLVWAERWDEILTGKLMPELKTPREQFWRHWARGLAFAAKKDVAAAKGEMAELIKIYGKSAAGEFAVAQQELQGHIALAEGKVGRAMKNLESASDAERHLRYNEPPAYPRPVAEAWGLAAQRAGSTKQAERAFRIALEQLPESVVPREALQKILSQQTAPVQTAGRD